MDAEVSHRVKYGPVQAHTQIDGGFLGNTICVVTSEGLQHLFLFLCLKSTDPQPQNHRY